MGCVGPSRSWGTWEELVLGGAVRRHGTGDWDVVASELRTRTVFPNYCFTPEACKARYEDLRKRYSGCTAWFEELRKRRVEELKRELERSENSIGSLESKIEILKAEREQSGQIEYGLSHNESPVPLPKSEDVESLAKDEAKDGLSAGSFTLDIRTDRSSESETPAIPSATATHVKIESCEGYGVQNTSKVTEGANGNGGAVRKRRGKRRRKDTVWDAKEGSIEESDNVCSTSLASTSHCKEEALTTSCDQSIRHSTVTDPRGGLSRFRNDDLMRIFNSITQHEASMVFRHRLDSQKRARYKKMIRRHMDIETVRSRLANWTIKTPGELFRDFLLLANNAMVFYSKRTREYKAGMALRDVVTRAYRHHFKGSYNKATSSLLPLPTIGNPPGKPRSVRPRPSKDKIKAKFGNHVVDIIIAGRQNNAPSDADSKLPLQSFVAAKKKPGKIKRRPVIESVSPQDKVRAKDATIHVVKVKEDRRIKPVTKERKRARQK